VQHHAAAVQQRQQRDPVRLDERRLQHRQRGGACPGSERQRLVDGGRLPAKASWLSTTPFGRPVEPDVSMTYAESSLTGGGTRPSGGEGQPAGASPAVCPAPVRSSREATTGGGVLRCSGRTTPPARQAPTIAAMSAASPETGRTTVIPGRRPALESRAASASATHASWRR
jgi:hypothetical protein